VVHETLPDTFFDSADEVVLVDLPAEELLARLAAGKVYLPAQAERAAKNFFRKGNLMALRELALRRTADRVEDDVQAYRADRSIDQVWKTEGALLCCIGPHEGAEHVVRSAAQLARQLAVTWHAVYVETPALQRLDPGRREGILQTVKLARDLGASTAVLAAQGVAPALVEHARLHNLSRLVLGHGSHGPWWPWRSLGQTLGRLAPDLDRVEVGQSGRGRPATFTRATDPDISPDLGTQLRRYGLAAAACAATTVLTHAAGAHFDLANIVMVFLLSVVGVAVWQGRGPSVMAAFLNVAAFDFFFVPPQLSFAVSDVQYLLTFAVMLVVGLVTGQLTAGLRFQASVATHREVRSRALFEAARDLSNILTQDQAIDAAVSVIGREFRAEVAIFGLDMKDRLQPPRLAARGWTWARRNGRWTTSKPAGLGTDTLAGSAWLYLPLKATMRARGVLAVQPREPRLLLVPEQRLQLETFAALTGMALERAHYIEVAQTATVQMESERLRNSLLAALSHDLRTPLAAHGRHAEMLAASQPRLSAQQTDWARALIDKSRRLADMVTNLLDMARIQSGEVRLRLDWQSMEEIIGGALKHAHDALGTRTIGVTIDPDVTLVECDAVLIERVLANLLENAGKYTPAQTPVEVLVRTADGELRVSVRDHGPGVAAGQEEIIFDKFTRGQHRVGDAGRRPGPGDLPRHRRSAPRPHLGGADAPAGATFTFSLPLGTPPAIEESDDAAMPLQKPTLLTSTPTPIALVLEDEREIRQFVRSSLEAEGWQVVEAGTVRQGLVEAGTRRPDLVIADLGLPDGDGVDFIRELRTWSGVPSSCCRRAPTKAKRWRRWTPVPTTTSPSPSAWPNCWRARVPTCGACVPAARRRTPPSASAMSRSTWRRAS
jgi:two-component system sensor histidine kinase KdpD